MTFEEIPNWIKAIGAAVTGIYTAYKVAFKPFRDYFKIKNERNQAMAVIAEKIPFILMAANKLMEKNDILWYRADKNGYTVEVSPQLCNILGYSEEELKKEGWLSYVIPAERASMKDEMMQCVASLRDFRMPATFVHREGGKHKYFVTAEFDKFSGWLGELRPIEKKAA